VELVPPEPPLTDGEIVLRTRREDDVAAIVEASHDPETRRRLDDAPPRGEAPAESLARVEEQWATGTGAPFVIADVRDDRPLGLVNLQLGEDAKAANLAVSVFPQARGRGIAAKALRLCALWGLADLGLARVAAEAAVDNYASIRAIEKAGFQREGTLRAHCETHGQRHDCVMFSLIASDLQPEN
jgi:[ribosomal protein S5]-alanine N-acetyltransferase